MSRSFAKTDAVTGVDMSIDYAHHEIHSGSHYYIEGHTTLEDTATLYVKLVTPDTAKWGHFTWDVSSSGICTATLHEGSNGGMTGGARAVIHANNRNNGKNCWVGTHTGAANAAVLTDSTQAWTPDALIDMQIFNQTDGSSGFITDNDANTVTVTLAGGTDNDFDAGDVYEINNSRFVITSGVAVATNLNLLISDAQWGAAGKFSASGGGHGRNRELVLKQNTTYLRTFTSGADDNIIQFSAAWYEHTDAA